MAMNNLLILVVLLGVTVTAVQSQLLIVAGTVYCDQGCTSPYAGAVVQLKCSTTIVKQVTADQDGCFSIGLDDVIDSLLYTVAYLQTCTLYVDTPVSKCNGAFGINGYLLSGITPLLAPAGFIFHPY